MRNIAVIGAGQSGLMLAHGLLQKGYKVTIYTSLSSSQILNARVMSSQVMFDSALQFERSLNLNFWDDDYPYNSKHIYLTVVGTDISWKGELNHCFQSVDQRLKFSIWLNMFEKQGGQIILENITVDMLPSLSSAYDLTIIATGKGGLGNIFPTDHIKTLFKKPMRKLALIYIKGMQERKEPGVSINLVPGIGEFFTVPGVSINGRCEMFLFEGIPGSEFDSWENLATKNVIIENIETLLKKYIPWEADRIKQLEISGDNDFLFGSYTPTVKEPYIVLNNKKLIIGIGDAIVLNDPIAGQGANNATRFAEIYLDEIISHKNNDFTSEWAANTFARCWESVKYPTQLSNTLLNPPKQVLNLLKTAKDNRKISNFISNSFDNVFSLYPWINSEEDTKNKLAELAKEEDYYEL